MACIPGAATAEWFTLRTNFPLALARRATSCHDLPPSIDFAGAKAEARRRYFRLATQRMVGGGGGKGGCFRSIASRAQPDGPASAILASVKRNRLAIAWTRSRETRDTSAAMLSSNRSMS